MGQLDFQVTSGAFPETSSGKKFEEMEKDTIQTILIEMMVILQMEMAAKDDAAIVTRKKATQGQFLRVEF